MVDYQEDVELKGTAYTAQREEQLKSGLDDELEDDLNIIIIVYIKLFKQNILSLEITKCYASD